MLKEANGELATVNISTLPENTYHKDSVMVTVFENGELLKDYTLDEVRQNENLLYKPELKV